MKANQVIAPEKLALLGGSKSAQAPPRQYPTYTERARERVDELLAQGRTLGLSRDERVIGEFEEAVTAFHGVGYCLGTTSGHAALHAALIGLEITSGDEVIATPYTWGASISAILHNNAIPVFADVDPETGLLDPEAIERHVTPRTRAILVVHIYGQPADMTAIRRVADKHALAVIEDGSQAHGAKHQGVRVGCFGDAAGFSCNAAKLVAATEAGYLVTNNERIYNKAVLSTQHIKGTANDKDFADDLRPFMDSLNFTYRLSTINAVLVTEQLTKLESEVAGRQANVRTLREELAGVKSARLPDYPEGDEVSPYAVNLVFDPAHAGVSRDTYVAALAAEGLDASVYIPEPIHQWLRLRRGSGAPRTLWDEMLAGRAEAYADAELPQVEHKCAHSFQLDWQRHYVPDPESMKQIAAAFHKVEEQLPALQAHERANG